MGYTLYGSRGSGSAAVEIALHWCGQAFDTVHASSWEPASAQAGLERVNPLRQIPTLVLPEGGVMTESAAILIELGLRHPDSGLLPSEPAARARSLRGLVYIAANCYSEVGISDYPERAQQPGFLATLRRIEAHRRIAPVVRQHWSDSA